MKHHYNILFILLPLLFCTCSDEISYDHLSLTPRALGISTGGELLRGDVSLPTFEAAHPQPHTVRIEAQNVAWSIENTADWLTLSSANGSQSTDITIAAAPNAAQEAREATLKLVSQEPELPVTRLITITQAAAHLPLVSAVTVGNIDKYSFIASATYTSDFEATECGFCYSQTNATPTITDTVIKSESLNGTTITGLTSARTYYIRAYAKSAVGIGYGEVKAVTTKGAKPGEDDNGMPSV